MCHFVALFITLCLNDRHFFPINEITDVLAILTLKLRITDLPLVTIEINEASETFVIWDMYLFEKILYYVFG